MKTKAEIEKKIDIIVSNEDNFVELEIDYVEGNSEFKFSDYSTRKTLEEFAKWLLDE